MEPRFFCPGAPLCGIMELSESDRHHMQRVLRLRPGDSIVVCDANGEEALCVLDELLRPVVKDVRRSKGESDIAVHLFPSLSKGERAEWLLQKAVELGAVSITPVMSERCIARAPDEAKRERWRRILRQAAEQCGRGVLPVLEPVCTFREALGSAKGLRVFCYEEAEGRSLKDELSEMRNNCEVSVFTGPEGGYSTAEAALAAEYGLRAVTLGDRILRSETAPLFVLSALQYLSL